MSNINPEPSSDLEQRKTAGRNFLNSNQVKDGLEVFAAILKDYPNDIESILIVGDLYLGSGDESTALKLYASALKLDPSRADIIQRIQMAVPESDSKKAAPQAEEIPSDPEAIARLLERLSGRQTPISEAEINRANDLLNMIVSSPNPAEMVSQRLDEIDALLPALIELNIRQANSEGRSDLANALLSLQTNINLQMQNAKEARKTPNIRVKGLVGHGQWKILFLAPDAHELPTRVGTVAEALKGYGCKITVASSFQPNVDEKPDAVIFCCPHTSQALLESMAFFSTSHIPVILDLENNYEEMPIEHPDYARLGLGTQQSARAYVSSLLLATRITTPNNMLMNRLKSTGYAANYIPDGWSRQNKLWTRPPAHRNTLNIGWMATTGQRDDLATIRRVVNRVIREFPHTQLVIAGDSGAYQLFDGLPEGRKLYLPPVAPEDYPYLLSQIDILLVPLRNIPYNHTVSDRILVEAGIKRIPWVASPVPAFQDWKAGGLLANTLDEWHTYLRQLVIDDELRGTLGEAGRQHSVPREMSGVVLLWVDLLNELIEKSQENSTQPNQYATPVSAQ
jgi:glycosyltransferase involved in cell wall biosynthesis